MRLGPNRPHARYQPLDEELRTARYAGRTSILVVCVLAAAVIALGITLRNGRDRERGDERESARAISAELETTPPPASDGDAGLASAVDLGEARDAATIAAATADAVVSTGAVAVVVTLADGVPDAGLMVQLKLGDGQSVLELPSDASGQVSFQVPGGTRLQSVHVRPSETTTPATSWLDRTCRAGDVVEVALRVGAGWPVQGQVLGPDDAPVPGAEVSGWCSEYGRGPADRIVLADERGYFRLEHLGPRFRVTARAPGLVCFTGLRGELSDAAVAEKLIVRLAPERRIRGFVVDPNQVPVEGAEVWVNSSDSSVSEANRTEVPRVLTFRAGDARDVSDALGAFELTGLSHEKHYVYVKRAPYLVDRQWRPTSDEPQTIVLDPGLSLRGRVIDSQGKPAAGARVRFWPYFANAHSVGPEFECDERGEFSLHGMGMSPTGAMNEDETSHAIAVQHAGHALHVVQPVMPSVSGGEAVTIRLEPERVIAGRVVDPAGKPLPGIDVWIEGDREMDVGVLFGRRSTWEYCNDLADAETDAQGSFRFEKLYDGEFAVHAVFPDDPNRTASKRVAAGTQELELVLDPGEKSGVVLVGRVRDSLSGSPLPSFAVVPMIAGSGSLRRFEDEDGRFEILGLPPGEIELTVRAPGYATKWIPPRDYAAGEHTLDLDLAPARAIKLVVVDPEGTPYRHGLVQAMDASGQVLPLEGVSATVTVISLREGKAALHGLPAERVFLRVVITDGRPAQHEVPVDLTNPLEEPLQVILERP